MATFGVKQIQERYGVGEHTVLGWIKSGLLKAVDIRRVGSSRAKWRVTQESLAAFEALRTPSPPPAPTRRRKRPTNVIEFYK